MEIERVAGKAALEITAEGLSGFHAARLSDAVGTRKIKAAVPVVQATAALDTPAGNVLVLVLGIVPERDRAVRELTIVEGSGLGGGDAVLLEREFARSLGFGVGSTIRLTAPSGAVTVPVAGLVAPEGAAAFNAGAIVFTRLETAQSLFAMPGMVNSLQLAVADGIPVEDPRARVEHSLPPGFTVAPPALRGALGNEFLAGTEQGLAALSLVSLVAGAFVILNTFIMSLNERRRQFALLRALGTTRRQLTRALLAEAAILAGVGTLGGIAAGMGFSVVMTAGIEQTLGVDLPNLRWSAAPFLWALLIGPLVALAATWFPARAAGARGILRGLFDQRGVDAARAIPRALPLAGAGLFAVVLGVEIGYIADWFPAAVRDALLGPTMMIFLVACILVYPLFLGSLLRASGRLFRKLGAPARLGARQHERHPHRTLLTAGALFVAVVIAIGMGNSLLNNIDHVYDWFDKTMASDIYLRAAMPDRGMVLIPGIPARVAKEVAALPAVERTERLLFVFARTTDDRQLLVIARTFHPNRPPALALQDGDPARVLEGLLAGEVVVATVLAQRAGLAVGDSIELKTRQGPRRLKIAGTCTEFSAAGFGLFMNWDDAAKLFDLRDLHVLGVTAREGRRAELETALAAYARANGLLAHSFREFRGIVEGFLLQIVGFFWVLIALVFLVASLGIVNTLTMNVLEQAREIGLLRAVAMRRREVRRMVVAEAAHLAFVAFLPGVIAGGLLAFAMSLATYSVSGHRVTFAPKPVFAATCVLVAAAISLAAAQLPARRAAGTDILRALQCE